MESPGITEGGFSGLGNHKWTLLIEAVRLCAMRRSGRLAVRGDALFTNAPCGF
jgi:hypothetical protein